VYVDGNPKTKKALKATVDSGVPTFVFSPGPFPAPLNGSVSLEGPHYPKPHSWYASAIVKNGAIVPGSIK
jgi:hypothetical protein